MLVGIQAIVDRRAGVTDVVEIDMARVQAVEFRNHAVVLRVLAAMVVERPELATRSDRCPNCPMSRSSSVCWIARPRPCGRTRRRGRSGEPGRRHRSHIAASTERPAPFSDHRRHGKVLFAEFEDAATLAMHFGTNGSLASLSPDDARNLRQHASDCSSSPAVRDLPMSIHAASAMSASPTSVACVHRRSTQLGPDALDPSFDETAFAAALANRQTGDQGRADGSGADGRYRQHLCRRDPVPGTTFIPGVVANALDAAARRRLFTAMKHVLQTAIDRGAGAENFIDRLPKEFLLPERHAGGHCPRCGTALAIDKRGGRTSYHCPTCQPEPHG